MAAWRTDNPLKASYARLKSSAKTRGIPFNLSLQDFSKFAKAHGYLEQKGNSRDSATIDRIENDKGYEIANLQILTRRNNSIKRIRYDFKCPS